MPSYIENSECQAKQEDRRAVIHQLLKIRYEPVDEVPSDVIDYLAKISSNEMLRLLLTQSWEGLLAMKKSSIGIDTSALQKDLFRISGPIEQYYLQKQGEKEALEALAKLRFGEIDETLRSAIVYLLQTPAKNSVQVLYTLTREELATQFAQKSEKS